MRDIELQKVTNRFMNKLKRSQCLEKPSATRKISKYQNLSLLIPSAHVEQALNFFLTLRVQINNANSS